MIAMRTGRHFVRTCTRAQRRVRDTQRWKRSRDEEQQQQNGEWSRGSHSLHPMMPHATIPTLIPDAPPSWAVTLAIPRVGWAMLLDR